jgi:CheY-like chemotaxis protein
MTLASSLGSFFFWPYPLDCCEYFTLGCEDATLRSRSYPKIRPMATVSSAYWQADARAPFTITENHPTMMPPRRAALTLNASLPVSPRVIVADDDPTISTVIARVIARTYHDAEVIIVSNGQAALCEYEQHGANLIVTDLNMPQMDGLALTRCIRAQDAAIPIVLVSGIAGSEAEAITVGITQVLAKPFAVSQLITTLTAVLSPLPEIQC